MCPFIPSLSKRWHLDSVQLVQSPAAIGYEARLCALPNHKRLSLERVLFSHSYHCSSWKGGKNICVNSPPFYFPCEYLAFRREKGRARETERRQNLPTVILPPLVWRLVLPIMKRGKMLKNISLKHLFNIVALQTKVSTYMGNN